MEIGIIHLTDIHLTEKSNLDDKLNSFCQAMKNELSTINNRYLVVSGDIANKGQVSEYIKAREIIDRIKNELNISKIILTPGNHDCNFDLDTKLRQNCIQNTTYDTIGNDDSVITASLCVQNDFWEFYQKFNEQPQNKLFYKITELIDDKKLSFLCYNTAWMSQKKETPATLFFPVKLIENLLEEDTDFNISVLHHPVSWFTPNSIKNNRMEFLHHLDKTSSIQLIGHEHENSQILRKDINEQTESLEFSGEIFNNNLSDDSGFQLLKIDMGEKKGTVIRYSWKDIIYTKISETQIAINSNKSRKLIINESFLERINDIKIPLTLNNKNINLSNIFVFPDIEKKELNYEKLYNYIDSEELISNSTYKNIILEGESQIGKTSLVQILFQKYYHAGFYPILLDGASVKNDNIDNIIKKKFNDIYSDNTTNYENFTQLEKSKKVLLIDDFHRNFLSSISLEKFVAKILDLYGTVIITIDSSCGLSTEIQTVFSNFDYFSIKQFGLKKTDDLIKKYFSLKSEWMLLEDQLKLIEIKKAFNQVRSLLGNKILPSYPVFILSLLKTLDDATYSLQETSYGYCYESLLYFALKSKANLKEQDLSKYLAFLEKLAFKQFLDKNYEFSEKDLRDFHNDYRIEHFIDDFKIVKDNLTMSYIVKEYDNTFEFGYKYIFYYLVAKHLSGKTKEDDGKKIINELFENLHIEENANILVFITHHTKDNEFIQDCVLQVMEPFENIKTISLQKDCSYYALLEDLCKNISQEIIDADIDPLKNREKNLIDFDNKKCLHNKFENMKDNQNVDINEHSIPLIKAFKSIDIVSQILKNRIGYLKKTELIDYITELYLAAFRIIGAVGESFRKEKDDLVKELIGMIVDGINKKSLKKTNDTEYQREYILKKPILVKDVEKKVHNFFQMMNLQICLHVFSKLIYSLGINDKEAIDLYCEVASRINTPASKLVSFSIISYYFGISSNEIEKLAKEFKDNPVALKILKARTIAYVYNNHIDFKKKQQISSILNLELKPRMS
ncbi:MAG: metallophosphoesterase [Candidatus Delongbacteria bacterium]|nr:metallophosphoesterase [Candidatus Delongbacteria bacterium]MBN2834869.1 metallophosphoesterase [Candidatus Delongbacteria bacterium]